MSRKVEITRNLFTLGEISVNDEFEPYSELMLQVSVVKRKQLLLDNKKMSAEGIAALEEYFNNNNYIIEDIVVENEYPWISILYKVEEHFQPSAAAVIERLAETVDMEANFDLGEETLSYLDMIQDEEDDAPGCIKEGIFEALCEYIQKVSNE